ncbi:MAG: glycoside hydrolase family 43 protein [Lachnospiraceae bacterium]|nr:glycoside hydrolase family 43 protein [Lachnospiraceae bacterium]
MTVQNPVIRGFNPDPSIIRVNDDYYTVTSTFEWWPGARLHHSKDLVNWTDMGGILDEKRLIDLRGRAPSCGVWACDLSYDGSRFYLAYTDVRTKKWFYNTHNYLIYADDIRGEWSDPVYLNSVGFDPSVFHDDDGRKYLINMLNGFKGITIQELDARTLKPAGGSVKIFEGTGIGCTEGPHIHKRDGYYYLIMAEGGTGYDHCVSVARSRNLLGPYTAHPDNPVLTSDPAGTLKRCGHGDLVTTKDGRTFIAFLCSRPVDGKRSFLGRETAINELIWKDGWPYLKNGGNFASESFDPLRETERKTAAGHVFRDDFSNDRIDPGYSAPRWDCREFAKPMHDDKGRRVLRIEGRESLNSCFEVSLLARRITETSFTAETKLRFVPECEEQTAGLCIIYDSLNFYLFAAGASRDGTHLVRLTKSDRGVISELCSEPVELPDEGLELHIGTVRGSRIVFSYRINGIEHTVDGSFDASILNDEYCRGFTGTHAGMYVHDLTGSRAFADFDYFMTEDET